MVSTEDVDLASNKEHLVKEFHDVDNFEQDQQALMLDIFREGDQ
jgi:hypothetical protein